MHDKGDVSVKKTPEKKIRHRVMRTVTGKVVYKRKPHLFNNGDLLRIFRHLAETNSKEIVTWTADIFRLLLLEVIQMNRISLKRTDITAQLIPKLLTVLIWLAFKFIDDAFEFLQSTWQVLIAPVVDVITTTIEGDGNGERE